MEPIPEEIRKQIPPGAATAMATTDESGSVELEPSEASQPNGVLVLRQLDENGNLSTPIQLTGDVKITEVETILKLALKTIKEALKI